MSPAATVVASVVNRVLQELSGNVRACTVNRSPYWASRFQNQFQDSPASHAGFSSAIAVSATALQSAITQPRARHRSLAASSRRSRHGPSPPSGTGMRSVRHRGRAPSLKAAAGSPNEPRPRRALPEVASTRAGQPLTGSAGVSAPSGPIQLATAPSMGTPQGRVSTSTQCNRRTPPMSVPSGPLVSRARPPFV